MKVLVCGYHNVGYLCLEYLVEHDEQVVMVITHQDDPSENIFLRSVRELAEVERGFLCRFQPIEQNHGEHPDPARYKNSPRWIQYPDAVCRLIDELIELKRSGAPILTSREDLECMKVYFTSPESVMQKIQAHEALDALGTCRHAVGNFVVEDNGDVRWCFQMSLAGDVRRDSPASIWRNRRRCWTMPCSWR